MISFLLQIGLYSITAGLACTGPSIGFVIAALVYALVYGGVELVLLGFLIDAYFLYTHEAIPYYTIIAATFLVCAQLIRPYLSLYNR